VAKPELGTKRVCPSCGTKYYDLSRNPILCPNCGTVFVVAATPPPRVAERKPEPVVKAVPVPVVAEIEREPDVVSLEEVEEGEEADIGPDVDADDEVAAVPDDVEVEVEDDDAAVPDPFLETEEEGDDVSGLLDVDKEQEEER
jgi:uncharacterized protein (TIGR02300 family)